MTFLEWFETQPRPTSMDADFDRRLALSAWNAAINEAACAVDNADYDSDTSGIQANAAALDAVERLAD